MKPLQNNWAISSVVVDLSDNELLHTLLIEWYGIEKIFVYDIHVSAVYDLFKVLRPMLELGVWVYIVL